MSKQVTRCAWVTDDPLYIDYHDCEWGQPVHDERLLFEFLILEGMQAGLSWITVLKKRVHYRHVFDHFDATKIARYTPKKIECLLQDPGIIRNRLKVNAVVQNSKAYLKMCDVGLTLNDYMWAYVDGKPIINRWKTASQVPVTTEISDAMARDLKGRGFKFVGSTICYAYMQAVGLVNDHLSGCSVNHDRCLGGHG